MLNADITKVITFFMLLMAFAFVTMAPGEDVCPACISAQQLYENYQADEAAADKKYKGQVVVVYGTVIDVGKDGEGGSAVILEDGKSGGVVCTVGEPSETINISPGQKIELEGTVEGIDREGNVRVHRAIIP